MPKFNLMSYIVPVEDKMFFTYFKEGAEVCNSSANLYNEIIHNSFNDEFKERALKYKKKGKINYQATLKQLNKTSPVELASGFTIFRPA